MFFIFVVNILISVDCVNIKVHFLEIYVVG